VLPWREYEEVRKERIRKIVEVKRRRLELGERLTLLFENGDTVLRQVQEMVYLDRLEEPERIQREIEVYSALLPYNGKVKATLYVNAEDFDDLFWVFKNLMQTSWNPSVVLVVLSHNYLTHINVNGNTFLRFNPLFLFLKRLQGKPYCPFLLT